MVAIAATNAGVPVSAGPDFPPIAPMMGLQGMVTRKGWNGEVWGAGQAITAAEGLRVWTLNGAYAAFEEDVKRSITPGKFADLVFLDRDPLTADPQTIKDIKVTPHDRGQAHGPSGLGQARRDVGWRARPTSRVCLCF